MSPYIFRRRRRKNVLRDLALVAAAVFIVLVVLTLFDFVQYRHAETKSSSTSSTSTSLGTKTTEPLSLDSLLKKKTQIEQKLKEGSAGKIPADKQQEVQRMIDQMF